MEALLTLGLVSVVLGTASGAQNLGPIAAIVVGAYIALAGLWASPISGASMNQARSFGPAAVAADLRSWWVYLAPRAGAVVAVGWRSSSAAAGAAVPARPPPKGALFTRTRRPDRS
jgi:aquaporin Z